MDTTDQKRQLRARMRTHRRSLSESDQRTASECLAQQLLTLPGILNAKRVGAYFANDGEIDPLPALEALIGRGSKGYLPVLFASRRPRLQFAEYFVDEPLKPGKYGIPVPFHDRRKLLNPVGLDWLFMPLVAFDEDGNRLGMGGGFYDASLASRSHRAQWRRPVLIGLAHEFQKVDALNVDSWDVPLDGILTDKTFRPISRAAGVT